MDYKKMANTTFVKSQYSDDNALKIRKSLHHKYSTNKQGFGKWLFSQYKFKTGDKVLEVGSGNGDLWESHVEVLSKTIDMTLSDFSQGMVDILREKYAQTDVNVQRVDIQDMPYEDETFDVVIANAMLYHVPDIKKALSEVHRVLKPGGTFYASTFGVNGLSKYLNDCLCEIGIKESNEINVNFTLQNGVEQLQKRFETIKRVDYVDSLKITDVMDLIQYIYSMTSAAELTRQNEEDLIKLLESKRNQEGFIVIPKEYGTFVSTRG